MPDDSLALFRIAHLIVLCLWGGLVACESVIELLPLVKKKLHTATIVFHFWIDVLVEAPLVAGVVVTGLLLAVQTQLTNLHVVKISLGGFAVSMNLLCIVLVIKRHKLLNQDAGDGHLWKYSRGILWTAGLGVAAGLVAAVLGFYLAFTKIIQPIS